MRKFLRKCWMWITGIAIVILGVIIYIFSRKKETEEDDPVLEMHTEALDILENISEKEHKEIETALKSETPEDDLAARVNSRGGPL